MQHKSKKGRTFSSHEILWKVKHGSQSILPADLSKGVWTGELLFNEGDKRLFRLPIGFIVKHDKMDRPFYPIRFGRIERTITVLKEASVPHLVPTAVGVERRPGMAASKLVLLSTNSNGAPLSAWIGGKHARISAREKCQLIRSAATFLGSLHDRGIRDVRFGPSDIWVEKCQGSFSLMLIVSHPVARKRKGLSQKKRLQNIAHLYARTILWASRNDAMRFYRAYFSDTRKLRQARENLALVENLAIKQAVHQWRRDSRKSLRTNDSFVSDRRGAFKFYCHREGASGKPLSTILSDPDRLIEAGIMLPGRGNSCCSAIIEIDGKRFVLKRYNCRGWWYRFRHIFRRSRALRTWLAGWELLAGGTNVAKPVFCLEERLFRFLSRSYVLSEFVEEAVRLSDYWPNLEEKKKRGLLVDLAVSVGRLHRFLSIHGDTNWDNILVRDNGQNRELFWVDLDCTRIFSRFRPQKVHKDIRHIYRDFDRLGPDCGKDRQVFSLCWMKWAFGFRKS